MNASGVTAPIGNKEPLLVRLRDAIAALEFVLEEFANGKTRSVSGNENRCRLSKALAVLRNIQMELTGKN